jgi:predicted XRE-type DNA-binding protein
VGDETPVRNACSGNVQKLAQDKRSLQEAPVSHCLGIELVAISVAMNKTFGRFTKDAFHSMAGNIPHQFHVMLVPLSCGK